ncbi:YtxH-like protein [Paenibacillaceae bacterium GAS479]|nr:YtxH-like protein [Paenibacillaceae bacterium GAS479]
MLGALAGGIIGSVTALLFAPKAGSELRADIGDRAARAADGASQLGEKIGSTATHAARQTVEGAAALKEKALNTADSLASGIKFWERKADAGLEVVVSSSVSATGEAVESFEELAGSLPDLDISNDEPELSISEDTREEKF